MELLAESFWANYCRHSIHTDLYFYSLPHSFDDRKTIFFFVFINIMTNKLPIPRIPHERRAASGRRISRACDACRARKAKCDGNRPRCAQCTAQGLDKCLYSDRKLVRLQKDFESEQGKREAYEGFLRDLSVEFEGPIADRIDKFLKVCLSPRTSVTISDGGSILAKPADWRFKTQETEL